jgi:hypothetical protein
MSAMLQTWITNNPQGPDLIPTQTSAGGTARLCCNCCILAIFAANPRKLRHPEDKPPACNGSEQLGCWRILLLSRRIIVDCTVKAVQRGSRGSTLAEKKAAFHSEHLHLG